MSTSGSVVTMRRQGPPPPRSYGPDGKAKKSWGQRLGLGREKGGREDDAYLLGQYRSRYGTLSGGSALCRSMRYAQPWLYGSVTPGMLLCRPQCACAELMGGTQRGRRPPGVCAACGGGTVRGTLRLGGGGHSRVRPSIISLAPAPPDVPHKAATPDPYDLMRRSRLSNAPGRVRARSTSPGRRPPPRELTWGRESPDCKRKSILECDVNAYELIAKYLRHGGSPPPGVPESTPSDDDVLEDELSDDLSDNALENNSKGTSSQTQAFKSRVPTACPTRAKTHRPDNGARNAGVTIGGQRIRVFSDCATPCSKEEEEFVSDEDNNKPSSHIPVPRRPPRRHKAAAQRNETVSEPREAEADESSLSQTARGTAPEGSVIKSILKKPSESASPPAGTFSDTIPDRSVSPHSPSPETGPQDFYLPTFQEFKQQHRKKKQVQFKVATDDVAVVLRVAEGKQCEQRASDAEEEEAAAATPEESDEDPQVYEAVNPTPRLQYFGDLNEDAAVVNAGSSQETSVPSPPEAVETPNPAAIPTAPDVTRRRPTSLRRSHSDRMSEGVAQGSRRPALYGGAPLFNDTMRLRPRFSGRTDSRQVFETRRLPSPGRPRPKEPPPPPPPPPPPATPEPRPVHTPQQRKCSASTRPVSWSSAFSGGEKTRGHRNSDPGPGPSKLSLRLEAIPGPTIVTVTPSFTPTPDVHRLQVTSEPQRRTSILINSSDGLEYEVLRSPSRTSVIIEDHSRCATPPIPKHDSNKVTINVGGADSNDGESVRNSSSSCTIINTSQSIYSSSSLPATPLVIPVVPGEWAGSTVLVVEETSALLDPVEAVRRNLVPHVCGRQAAPSAVDRLSTLIQKSEECDAAEELSESEYFPPTPGEELNIKALLSIDSDASLKCDDGSASPDHKDIVVERSETASPTTALTLSHPRFTLVAAERDGQDVEVELRSRADDNEYESIKDPIYEEIPDTPPPLPLSPPPTADDLDEEKRTSRSIFEGASKYDILSYLEGAKERGIVPEEDDGGGGKASLEELSSRASQLSNASDSSEDSCNLILTPASCNKVRKSSADVERNDSGVGSETSKSSRSRWQHIPAGGLCEDQMLCEDCDQGVETQVTDSGVMFAPLVCRKCSKKRAERKEILGEIVETEEKYGRDLRIILEEFYRPMLVAGLLSPDQLGTIFLNVEELLEHNASLAEKLRDALEIALEQGDEDLLTVNMGSLFLEAAPMLNAFESYCTRQGGASVLLANLEKEKELLRIFLRVSQMENAVLRRMNLNSFLMVPVQRVTKYPLLLARLYKVTPAHHEGRELLKQAQHKIELHLEHMNAEAKDVTSTKLWRRISIINGRRSSSETDMIIIKLRKMALDILEWNHDEVRFSMEGKLLYTNPTDNNWRRGRTVKFNPINALLIIKGKPLEEFRSDPPDEPLMFPRKNGVQEATLLLVKEKCGRYSLLRDPLYLDKCIVCCESGWEEYFEVQELTSKETYIFRGEDGERTKAWYRVLQYHAQGLGAWRRRRNALANIMINGMLTRN